MNFCTHNKNNVRILQKVNFFFKGSTSLNDCIEALRDKHSSIIDSGVDGLADDSAACLENIPLDWRKEYRSVIV